MKWYLFIALFVSNSYANPDSFVARYTQYKKEFATQLDKKLKPIEDSLIKSKTKFAYDIAKVEALAMGNKKTLKMKLFKEIEEKYGKNPDPKNLDYQIAKYAANEAVWNVEKEANLTVLNLEKEQKTNEDDLNLQMIEAKVAVYNEFYPQFSLDFFDGDKLQLNIKDKKKFCGLKKDRYRTQKNLARKFHEIKAHSEFQMLKIKTKYERRIHKDRIGALKGIKEVIESFGDFKPEDEEMKKKWLTLNEFNQSRIRAYQELESIESAFIKKKAENKKLKRKFNSRGRMNASKFRCEYTDRFITLNEKEPSEVPY